MGVVYCLQFMVKSWWFGVDGQGWFMVLEFRETIWVMVSGFGLRTWRTTG